MKVVVEMTAEEKNTLMSIYPHNWTIEDIVLDRYEGFEVRIIED